jgi:HSP20 family protein
MDSLHYQIDELLGELLNPGWAEPRGEENSLSTFLNSQYAEIRHPVTVKHLDKQYYEVSLELAGFKKEDVDITLKNNVLTIKGQKKVEKSSDCVIQEARSYKFTRSIKLPTRVDQSACHANLTEGILTIRLTKLEQDEGTKIPL